MRIVNSQSDTGLSKMNAAGAGGWPCSVIISTFPLERPHTPAESDYVMQKGLRGSQPKVFSV